MGNWIDEGCVRNGDVERVYEIVTKYEENEMGIGCEDGLCHVGLWDGGTNLK